MDYKQLDALLTGRCKQRRKLANNTYAERRFDGYANGCGVAIKLHDTDVLTFYADGRVRYDSGGWKTVTTKERMNAYGPALVFTEKGRWYIRTKNDVGCVYVYEDGLTVGPRGGVKGAKRRQTASEPHDKVLKRRARTLANALVSAAPLPVEDGPLGCSRLVRRALTRAHVGGAYAARFQAYIDDLEKNYGARVLFMNGIRPGRCLPATGIPSSGSAAP